MKLYKNLSKKTKDRIDQIITALVALVLLVLFVWSYYIFLMWMIDSSELKTNFTGTPSETVTLEDAKNNMR